MKVLFAITNGETGGAQEHLRILANGLSAGGHTVHVATTVPSELASALGQPVQVVRWHHIVRNPHPLNDLRGRSELAAMVRDLRPDILHLYSAKAGVLGRRVSGGASTRTIYTCHHAPYGPGRKWWHRGIGRPIEQLTLRFVDGIIVDGARDVPMIRKLAPRVPIRVIPNATSPVGPPRSPLAPSKQALWVARMRHPKDPLQAIAAWERVHERHPTARLVMCGEGPLLPRVRSAASKSPAASSIAVLGKVPSLDPHVSASSVFVLATHVEGGTTMATLEAMADGLVPVISDAGDSFVLERARCGVVVPRRSARAMGEAIAALFDDTSKLLEMRERAITFARSSWTVDDFVAATLEFYAEIRNRKPA